MDPCVCAGSETARKTVTAKAVIACIAKSRPVSLSHVDVVGGNLDLSNLPATRLSASTRLRLAGLPEPRANLELDKLERELGRIVPGALVVREPLVIRNSIIHGAILGPAPVRGRAVSYCPLAFLQTVNLSGTTVKGGTYLPYSRFRLPLLTTNSTLEGEVNFRGAWFADNVLFTNTTFHRRVTFQEATFERNAVFIGSEFSETAAAQFSRTVFRQGAWFQGADRSTRLRNADFSEAEFQVAEANFEAVTFEGVARFTKARLAGGARFVRSHFTDLAQFDDAHFSGPVAFDRAIFVRGAEFPRATFEATPWVSFDGSTFVKLVVFDGARFAGPTHFVEGTFDSATFLDVHFAGGGGGVDFRGAKLKAVEFGSVRAKTTFGGPAALNFKSVERANFENAQFEGRVSFSGATFGGGPACGAQPPIVVNFAAAAFAGVVDFTGAVFSGHINFSSVAAEPGRAKLRWHQISDRFTSESLKFEPEPKCAGRKEFAVDGERPGTPRTEVLRWLERNFRAQELLRDAREAFYELENEESWALVRSTDATCVARAGALFKAVLYGVIAGYGVRPSHVFITIAGVLVAFWGIIYGFLRRRLRSYYEAESPVSFKVTHLPWRPNDTLVLPRESSLELALWVSLAALLSVQVKGAYILMTPTDRLLWALLAFERGCGYALLILLGHTVSNAMPGLEKLLGWLPGI